MPLRLNYINLLLHWEVKTADTAYSPTRQWPDKTWRQTDGVKTVPNAYEIQIKTHEVYWIVVYYGTA